jgi:hypothetical protein
LERVEQQTRQRAAAPDNPRPKADKPAAAPKAESPPARGKAKPGQPDTEPLQGDVTAEQVRKAIDGGVAYLLGQQRNDGSWPDYGPSGGLSALCTLALLNAGAEPDDERIQKALRYLRQIKPDKTYTVALQTMVFARAEPERDRGLIERNVKWLEQVQVVAGQNAGAWNYPGSPGSPGSRGDESNSQFALLALHEAERVGVVAKDETWRLAQAYWESCQNQDGSWGYMGSRNGSGSMTCAGIASLVLTADRVQPSDARAVGDLVECCLARPIGDTERIERAISWLGQHYSVAHNPGSHSWLLYYLYGLDRVGRLSSRQFIPLPSRPGRPSRADWFCDGASHLVHTQDALSGSWTGECNLREWGKGDTEPVIGTSFALLFLSKGRWPVLMAKLQYGDGDDWNRHRSDVGNLTRYVETRWRRDLTWQVIDLRLAGVDDLLRIPVLHLCGARSPLPDAPAERKELARKLRDYLDRGGFLMAEANCGGADFDKGFRDLMREVFPEPEYELQLLEPGHPI